MARPVRFARWGELAQYRTEPAAGTVTAGYPYGYTPPYSEWNWLFWACGQWQVHLDRSAMLATDLWDVSRIYRLTSGFLSFTVGGPLAQRPSTGAVYAVNGERLDLSPTGANAPVYTFTASTSNYIFARQRTDNSRSAYPETAINTTGVAPAGYSADYLVRVDTNVTQVTAIVEGAAIQQRTAGWGGGVNHHEFQATMALIPPAGTTATTLQVQSSEPGIAPVVYVVHQDLAAFQSLVQGDANDTGTVFVGSVAGAGGAVATFSVGDDATGCYIYCSGTGAAGLHIEAGLENWALCFTPSALDPPHDAGSPYGNTVRVWGSSAFTPGLVWKNPSGDTYYPWASLQGATRYDSGNLGDSGAVAAGAANITIATSTQQTFVQGCRYLIMLDCGASTTSAPNFTSSLTVLINGSADTYWNARSFTPNVSDANPRPWLQTCIFYNHTAATTTTATVVIRVTHGAGVGNINYRAPRIQIMGGVPS